MEQISIRSLQHYIYCPHRWGLIEIDCSWAENGFVTKGNIIHERVHSGDNYKTRGKQIYTSVKVWHDELGLYGETDCIERKDGKYTIVEYKPTKPKDADFSEPDAIQVFAQKICTDNVLSCQADAEIYYADIRKRIHIPLQENYSYYMDLLNKILFEIRAYKKEGTIPRILKGQNCSGCSMKDMCMPSTSRKKSSIRKSVREMLKEEL